MATPSKEIKLAVINARLLTLQARVIRQQTRVASGIYKSRNVICAGRRMNEDELLIDEMNILDRHINHMQELTESIFDLDEEED